MLHIGVLGYSYDLSIKQLREIVNNDMTSKPKRITRNNIIMEDGTKFTVIPSSTDWINWIKGYKFDQLLLVDDNRWMIFNKHYDLIEYLKGRLSISFVPEEFKILKYEW